jgi:hypothetical protein
LFYFFQGENNMFSKSVFAGVAGLAVAGFAVAGGQDVTMSAPAATVVNNEIQGNSVWPHHTFTLAGGKLTVGAMATVVGQYSSKAAYGWKPYWYTTTNSGSSNTIYMGNANIFVGGDLGIAQARLNIMYFDPLTMTGGNLTAAGNTTRSTRSLTLDEGYVNFRSGSNPLYVRVGQFYESFGHYSAYKTVSDLTQLMTQVNGVGAEAGYAGANGLYANAAAFSNTGNGVGNAFVGNRHLNPETGNGREHVLNATANAGYNGQFSGVDVNLHGGWLRDARDLDSLFSGVANQFVAAPAAATNIARSSVMTLGANVAMNNIDASVHWARFNKAFNVRINNAPRVVDKPYALDLGAGYKFNTMQYDSHIGVGYQMSRDAEALMLPKNRYFVDYTLNFNKHVSANLAWYRDKRYSSAESQIIDAANPLRVATSNNLFMLGVSVAM